MESSIKRVMDAQAKAAANGGVGDVYRDGEGGIWWDADEEWEYAHLLGGEGQAGGNGDKEEWVQFGEDGKEIVRRESVTTVSTQDSDLDMRYIVQPIEESDDLLALGSSLASHTLPTTTTTTKPGTSILGVPHRPAKHLRKAEYIVDIAFTCPRTPTTPKSPKSPRSPRFFTAGSCGSKPRGAARRRPAPLKLSPPSPAYKRPSNSPASSSARRDFLESSFAPSPLSPNYRAARQTRKASKDSNSSGATITVARRAVAKKASLKNVKAFFKSAK